MKDLPQVGDVVKVTYFGVVTDADCLDFELDSSSVRHNVSELTEFVIFTDEAPVTALMRSFDRVNRNF